VLCSFQNFLFPLVGVEIIQGSNAIIIKRVLEENQMKIIAKVRYVDFQKRSHTVEVESDSADRRHLEDLVRAKYPADKVYFQSVRQK